MPAPITQLLQEWSTGNSEALELLMPLVYDRLRQMALRQLLSEHNVTLQPTELVHEVFLKLQNNQSQRFRDRIHFYGAAAQIMRRILIDLSRRRTTFKHGSGLRRVGMQEVHSAAPAPLDVEALDRAIEKLRALDPRQAQIVHLRFFAGLSTPEVAQLLNTSESTIKREWAVAKAWLSRECQSGD